MLQNDFFDRDTLLVAKELLGKVIYHKYRTHWLSAKIIETEAYYLAEKGSHASLGYTEKRRALFMLPGAIYMYYARGGDSLNISTQGEGNAVLIKSAVVCEDNPEMIRIMQHLNPIKNTQQLRAPHKLCSGQTLLCKALHIKVPDWNAKNFDPNEFFIKDIGYTPRKIIQTTRLGIPVGRDQDLLYRFIDYDYAKLCTKNPLTKKLYTNETVESL